MSRRRLLSLRGRLRQLRPYLIGLETRWRLESPLVAEMSPRRLLGVAGNSNMFDFFGDFFQSPAGLGDVSATSPRPAGDVAATSSSVSLVSSRSRRRRGDVSDHSAGDWKMSPKKKIEHVSISRDSPETRLVSRRRRGDIAETSPQPAETRVAN